MLNVIRIKNISFYAYHGALKEEQNIGGIFEADVDMYCDFSKAAEFDDLKLTVNYHDVYKHIIKLVHQKKYHLIESIVTVIADELIEAYPRISKIAVRVRKHSVPLGGVIDYVEAEIVKDRFE